MKTADKVEKKTCANCTIMNFMLIITAIAIVLLMSSCVPPSSVREGRVVGFDQRNDRKVKREEIAENKEEVIIDDEFEALKTKALQETYALKTTKKVEEVKEEPKIKPLEDQLRKLQVRNDLTNEKVNVIERDIREIKKAILELKGSITNPQVSANKSASTGEEKKEFTIKSDEEASKEDEPIVVTAASEKAIDNSEPIVENHSAVNTDFTVAEKYLEKKDYHRAIRELKELENTLQDEIKKAECRYLLGESHYNLKQYAKAIHYFVKVLQSNDYKKRDQAQVMLAESHMKAGESSKAKNVYKTLLSENPRSQYVPVARKMLQQL